MGWFITMCSVFGVVMLMLAAIGAFLSLVSYPTGAQKNEETRQKFKDMKRHKIYPHSSGGFEVCEKRWPSPRFRPYYEPVCVVPTLSEAKARIEHLERSVE